VEQQRILPIVGWLLLVLLFAGWWLVVQDRDPEPVTRTPAPDCAVGPLACTDE
jgi:hypothetical protein